MKKWISVLALVIALALPVSASAQSAGEGYGQAPGAHSSGDPNGSLPFTGLELGALAILGAGLIGTGVALHVARSREQQG
jgi:hypothetical protein